MVARGGGWTLCFEADVVWGPVVITGWHTAASTLNNGGYWEFNSYIGSNNSGIEIENPGRGHCFDQGGEDNSWGRAGVSQSCFLETSLSAFYNGLIHVEYWLR